MKKLPFILKDLSIRKMPGFPRGLEALNNLAANVNIITGANASGKSSTARVIQQLIWHSDTKGLEAEGSVILGQDSWEIKIDAERILVQRNGNDAVISGLPTTEGQQRYLLALHNLVEDKENDLANEIVKQSIGGFDLEAAQKALGYSSKISIKSSKEFRIFEDATRKYKEVRERQEELKRDESRLADLQLEKERAENAMRQAEFYDKVAEYLEVKLVNIQLSDQMHAFPNAMKKVLGKEYEDIQDYENQLEECKINIAKAKYEIGKSQNVLENLTIPEDGITDRKLSEFEERLDLLTDFERYMRDCDTQISGLKHQEATVLKGFKDLVDPTTWKGLNMEDVSGLDEMLQGAYKVLGEKEFLLSEINILEEEAKIHQNENQHSDVFTLGIKTLSDWLKEPTSVSNGVPLWIVILISITGIASAIAIFYVGWIGFLGLVLILVLFLYAFFTQDKSANSLSVRESDFSKSGLKAPSKWITESVVNRIDELIRDLSDNKEAERISQRLKSAKDKLKKLQNRIDIIIAKREVWVDKLQAAPGFPDSNSNDYSSMYWFVMQVRKWQNVNTQRESLEANRQESKEQYVNEFSKINALFESSNFDKVNDAIEGKAGFNELKNQENIRKDHIRIIQQKSEEVKNQEKLKGGIEVKLSKVYSSLDVEENNKESVRDLINKLEPYKQMYNDQYAANQTFLKKEKLLREHSFYGNYEEEIKVISIDQAKQESKQNNQIPNGLEDIQKQITEIETLIQAKKKGHELEDVLSEKEDALDNLNLLYEKNVASATGYLIINQLKKQTQNKNRPKVFKRANEIFNKITNGRYELSLDDSGEPNFRAYDTVSKKGQDLSELSTGTRVQLLLSVRLAYVETVESSIKLPLMADELLANSDDERARAIIESLIEISREGRQVFYFTAQADEVDKWMAHLKEEPNLDYKIFQLSGGSNKSYDYNRFEPDPNRFSLTQKVLAPNGKSHAEYGNIIQKQPFNVLVQETSELPLWYLIEDVDLLYASLTRGIKTWGQLESYSRNAGKIQNFDDLIYSQLQNKVELLKRFQDLYRGGRSLPIDKNILESSGAISAAFMDRIADKMNEFNREPKQLIHALKTGAVPRFRVDNADELEQYLIGEGYIDEQNILEQEEIFIKVQAFISNSEIRIEDAENFINRILKNSN